MYYKHQRIAIIATQSTLLFCLGWISPLVATQGNDELIQALRWRNIGPFAGGRASAVSGLSENPHTFFQGTSGGGLWRTEDAGTNWVNVSDGQIGTGSIGSITIAPSNPNIIYMGTGEGPARGQASSDGDGIYKSIDGGITWKHTGLRKSFRIPRIRVHPTNPDIVLVAVQGNLWGASQERGVYRSVDGGENWENVLWVNDTTGAADLSMDLKNPSILYATLWDHLRTPWFMRSGGPGSAIYKTTDGGNTWGKLNTGLPTGTLGKMGIAVSPAQSNRVFAIIEANEGGLYRSDDAGETWLRISKERLLFSRPWYFMRVYTDPSDQDTVYVLNMQMTKSIDGGKTFKVIPTPHGDNHDLWINPENPSWMINANDGGSNVSLTGGTTWSTQDNQPTGQFYRVITDQRFPYHVYGAQQDNNSALALPSRSDGAGIGANDVYEVGGGESGFVAFEASNPRFVYAGANLNVITEFDHQTRQTRNIMAYPEQGLGRDGKDLRYRFNWNAPILVSPHDPEILYHASNIVLRSKDRGQSWAEISPDLTRNETKKHGSGGGPITGEAAGGEYYNTILYLSESPHEKGVLWAGTDDGLLYLTRDGGRQWLDVTPPNIGEAQINSIEISPHNPSTVLLAVTGYRRNDRSPVVLRTDNNGNTWKKLTKGFRTEDFIRAVREDLSRPDLLYAASQSGVYISLNGGNKWESLQLNLPVVPVTDISVTRNDLVISTEGRGFWILDDLTPLRQFNSELQKSPVHLFSPRPAYRVLGKSGNQPGLGENPPNGAIIDYYFSEPPNSEFKIEILDQTGAVVRSFTSLDRKAVDAPSAKKPVQLSSRAGANRLIWDLRHEPIIRVPEVFLVGVYFGTVDGYRVPPGTYKVRLSYKDILITRDLDVVQDPRSAASTRDFQKQSALLKSITDTLNAVHSSVIRLRMIHKQATELQQRLAHSPAGSKLGILAESLVKKIKHWEKQLIQTKHEAVMDVVNFPTMLNEQLLFVKGAVASADSEPTTGSLMRFRDLTSHWEKLHQEMIHILDVDLATLNREAKKADIPEIVLPNQR